MLSDEIPVVAAHTEEKTRYNLSLYDKLFDIAIMCHEIFPDIFPLVPKHVSADTYPVACPRGEGLGLGVMTPTQGHF